jgi:HSP20 family protein
MAFFQRPSARLARIRFVVTRIFFERRDASEDLADWFDWLDDHGQAGNQAGECSPSMDVLETAATIEILVDLPGVQADALNVVISKGVLIVAGEKLPARCAHHEAAFHLVERGFGRFARGVRLAGAFDGSRATATLSAGELRIVLPRIEERRGKPLRILVKTE